MRTVLGLGISLALLLASAQPANAHKLEVEDPEPDHVLQWVAHALYPIGDIINHLLFGPHDSDSSEGDAAIGSRTDPQPQKPKYNFSPRRKHPQQSREENR